MRKLEFKIKYVQLSQYFKVKYFFNGIKYENIMLKFLFLSFPPRT